MKKTTLALATTLCFLTTGLGFAQQKSARKICDEAMEKGSPQNAVSFLEAELQKPLAAEDKRALFAYLGNLEEMLSMYSEAQKCYAQAAGIAAGDASGLPKKSSEALVIDAVRCALCAGEAETALSYLNSAVRNSKSPKIQAEIKLYEQWARLSIAEDIYQTEEAEELLKAYANLPSMETVRPKLLLTLWYLNGGKNWSDELLNKYPNTAEAAIVSGKMQVLPTPFWFFLPRKANFEQENVTRGSQSAIENGGADSTVKESTASRTESSSNDRSESSAEAAVRTDTNTAASSTSDTSSTAASATSTSVAAPASQDNSSSQQKAKERLQLGLFRDKNNALNFASRIKEKGFSPYIIEETRASGNVYYLVIVDEDADHQMSLKLKSAGFESYPLF